MTADLSAWLRRWWRQHVTCRPHTWEPLPDDDAGTNLRFGGEYGYLMLVARRVRCLRCGRERWQAV